MATFTLNFSNNTNANAKVPSGLLIDVEQEKILINILSNLNNLIIKSWSIYDQEEANIFLEKHGFKTEDDNIKWAIRRTKSSKLTSRSLYQCLCESISEKHRNIENYGKNRKRYPFVGCLAFGYITTNNNDGSVLKFEGYLTHPIACKQALPIVAPKLMLNLKVRQIAENMLAAGMSPKIILGQNMKFVEESCGGNPIVGNEKLLLTSKDLYNIRRTFYKKDWEIDVRKSVAINLENLFSKRGNNE
ncbi:6811_t:CDS:1, partial [Ambispora gerdemannii]